MPADHVYAAATRSLCSTCRRTIDARVHFVGDEVRLRKRCPEHGEQDALLARGVAWWLDALTFPGAEAPPGDAKPVRNGCPNDCGPCEAHQARLALPVLPITSACNLACPVCYTHNRNADAWHATDLGPELRAARARSSGDVVNLTGGEPTRHPDLPGVLRQCADAGFRQLTVSTNGLRMGDLEALRDAGIRVVLSLDSFDPAVDRELLGVDTTAEKLALLERLAALDVPTTLLPAVAKGRNDRELPRHLELLLTRPHVVSLEIHPLAFTGRGGASFDRSARVTTPEIHAIFAEATGGALTGDDFVPSPLAHPHCYSIAYLLLLDGGGFLPLARLFGRRELHALLAESLYLTPSARVEEAFRSLIDRLWAEPFPGSERALATIRRMLRETFPSGRPADRRRAERTVKGVVIHAHMDEETFDVGRVMRCCVGVPEADGGFVPTCVYNVRVRAADPRFRG